MLVHGYKQANNPFDQLNASLLNKSINNNKNLTDIKLFKSIILYDII